MNGGSFSYPRAWDFELSAIELHNQVDERQTQADALYLASACFVGTEEAFADMWQIIGRNSLPGVAHDGM